MRKLINFLPIFLLSLCLILGFSSVSSTYYGEEPVIDGGYYYVTFLESEQYIIPSSTITEVEVLVVGGGGAAADVAGGGAGGLVYMYGENSYEFNATEISNGYINVTVGNGGLLHNGDAGDNGGNSTFGHLTALGGGGAPDTQYYSGGWVYICANGVSGGCGSGAGCQTVGSATGGSSLQSALGGDSGTYGYGNIGGNATTSSGSHPRGGGGGGAGGAGHNSSYAVPDGVGGIGLEIWGDTYATGGSGGTINTTVSANTGNGGNGYDDGSSGNGASGIVIVRFAMPTNIPEFYTPEDSSTLNVLKVPIGWDEVSDVDYYELRWDDNASFTSPSSGTYSDENTVIYLANGDWYFDIRAMMNDGNYSPWLTDFYDPLTFTKNDKPVITLPSGDEVSAQVNFEWSSITDFLRYNIEIYTDANLSVLYANASVSDNTHIETLVNDDYWVIVQAEDDFYTGAWSDPVDFNLLIAEIPFTATPNTVNLYVGDTLQYDITGMDENVSYNFKINRIDDSGNFVSNITTKTLVGDADGNGSFTYTFPAGSFYPFEVRYHESNARLYTHYVAPKPTSLYLYDALGHRTSWAGEVMSVAIGDVAYNNWTGPLHDPYDTTESLYETDDYVLLHYSLLPTDTNISTLIEIKNMQTEISYLIIDSDDLHDYQPADENFIIIPLNGIMPAILDDNLTLDSYRQGNWTGDPIFVKGAYDYAQYAPDADDYTDFWYGGGWVHGDEIAYSYGESVLLIGDSDTVEWSVTPASSSVVSGKELSWTIACNTEKIWNVYNQMYFRDKSSDSYYIGGAGDMVSYPSAYAESFIIKYNAVSGTGGCIFRVGPEDVNFDSDLVNYDYVFDKSVTITDPVDNTLILIDILEIFGFGSVNGKLMFSMLMIIIIAIATALVGVPASIIALIIMAFAVIMASLGFIPIWVIVIIGLAMILLLIRAFTSGGGGEE